MTRMAERLLSEVAPALLRPGGLQDLAAALERTLAAGPHDADALSQTARKLPGRRIAGIRPVCCS